MGKENTSKTLEELVSSFQTRIGVVFMECKKLFTNTNITYTQHDPIREHGDFYQSNLLWKQIIQKTTELQNEIGEEQYAMIQKHIAHIIKVFDSVVNINKKMYGNGGEFYFTFSESQKYTDWKEFVDIFTNKVIFLSNSNKQYPTIKEHTSQTTQPLHNIPKIDALIEHIQTQKKEKHEYSCFIFSPRKEESKKIFEDICGNSIHKTSTLLVENITGGVGKNIFKAKQTKNKIII